VPRVKIPLEDRLVVYNVLRCYGVKSREALKISKISSSTLSRFRRENPDFDFELYLNDVRRRLTGLFFKLSASRYAELEKAVFEKFKFEEPKLCPLTPERRKRLIDLIRKLRG
jgi:hypothetical protein